MFGENILPLLALALGGALAVGTALALVNPPATQESGALERPPLARSVVQIGAGLLVAVWALVSMLT